jgi:hypothetical protein
MMIETTVVEDDAGDHHQLYAAACFYLAKLYAAACNNQLLSNLRALLI